MNFSPAEKNVVTYVDIGLSNKEIGDRLCVCEKTVKFHLTNIFKKAGVSSRAEFMAKRSGIADEQLRGDFMSGERQPLAQGARAVQVVSKTQEDKVQFINTTFKVGESIEHMHKLMKDVTKGELNPNTVNAACNCVARINETINTAIQAAKFLNER